MHSKKLFTVREDIRLQLIHFLLIAIIGVIIYSNSFSGEFVCDDFGSIVNKEAALKSFRFPDLWKAYNTRIIGGTTFAINYYLGGFHVFGYHALNLFIHILNSILVYLFIFQLLKIWSDEKTFPKNEHKNISFFTALIFLTHPIQVQSVSYIVQRYTSLASLFYLSALILYCKGRTKSRKSFYVGSFSFFLLGTLTKEIVYTLPVMLLILEIIILNGDNKYKGGLKKLFYLMFPLALMGGGLSFWRVKNDLLTLKSKMFQDISHYFLTEITLFWNYFKLLFFPINLSHSYDVEIITSMGNVKTITAFLLLLFLGGIIFWAVKKQNKFLALSLIWFFVTLSVHNLFAILFGARGAGLIYDHWLYLPMMGFSLFLVIFCIRLLGIKKAHFILYAFVIVFSVLTFQRNSVWKTEISLWEDNLRKNPKSIVNNLALGCAYQKKGLYHKALAVYEQTALTHTKADPEDLRDPDKVYLARIYNNLGLTSYFLGHDAQAVNAFKNALEYSPENASASLNLGITYFQLKQFPEAIEALKIHEDIHRTNPYWQDYLKKSYEALKQSP